MFGNAGFALPLALATSAFATPMATFSSATTLATVSSAAPVATVSSAAPMATLSSAAPVANSTGESDVDFPDIVAISAGPPSREIVNVVPAGSWDPSIWETTKAVGGSKGGLPFALIAPEGTTVTKIRFFKHDYHKKEAYLRGVRVFFSDDSEMAAGSEDTQYEEIDLQGTERVKRMTLWWFKDRNKSRVGRVNIQTDQTHGLDYGLEPEETEKQPAVAANIGSGVLIGFTGRAGLDLDQLSPVFLKKMDESRIEVRRYEPFDSKKGVSSMTIDSSTIQWNGAKYTFHFGGARSETTSTSWSTTMAHDVTFGTQFSAKFLGIGADFSLGWGFHYTTTTGMSESKTKTFDWSLDVPVNGPEDAGHCEAMVSKGQINLRWVGTQQMRATDGTRIRFPVKGKVSRVDYSRVHASCSPNRARRLDADN